MISQQNSQDEEGFHAAKLVQKVSEIDDIRDSKGKQCRPFSPFCLPTGQGPLRLQLPQSLDQIEEFQIKEQKDEDIENQERISKAKGVNRNYSNSVTLQHPYRVYSKNSTYQLVYSKSSSQQPLLNEFQYIRNDIMLQTAQRNNQDKVQYEKKNEVVNLLRNPYSRLLRSFDYSIFTQMPRNNSLTSQKSKTANQLLVFDSRFESGNLYCAYNKIGTDQYHLFLQNDTNSYGYNQWFYFSLLNIKKDTQYTFVIVNFKKRHSFFKYGYKPIIFSHKKYQQKGNQNGWYRGGYNIDYQDSNISTSKFFKFYKLTFTLKFQHDNDYALVAANLPYSFSRLSNYLDRFTKQFHISCAEEQIASLKVSGLGRTFCGNNVPQIKFSPNQDMQQSTSPSKKKKKSKKQKKMIVFMARQHPGQTVSSFLMQNILQQLSTFGYETEDSKQRQQKEKIKYLLKNYIILIYPMINIDGVIYGNSRCDVSGMDLNRRWKNPSKTFHPQIYNIKNKLEIYSNKYDIVGCFDLHGHSKLYNVFCYSCKINPISCRILPYIISKQTNKFDFPSCTFGITRYKSTTARANIFKTIKNENVLTIQMSYFGFVKSNQNNLPKYQLKNKQNCSKNQKKTIQYFQPKTFHQIAKGILRGLQIFLNKSKTYNEAQNQIKSHIDQILNFQKLSHQNDEGSGSESDPEGDEIDFQTKLNTILGKEFLIEASYFQPAEQENIDIQQLINPTNTLNMQQQSLNLKTQEQTQVIKQIKDSTQKVQKINKIRITKIKPDISNNKTFSAQKLKNQLNFMNTSVSKPGPKQKNIKKETISFSLQPNSKETTDQQVRKRFNSTHQQRPSNASQRLYSQSNQRINFGVKKDNLSKILNATVQQQQRTVQTHKVYDDLIIYSAQSKQMLNADKSNLLQRSSLNPYLQLGQNEFFLKFQRFFPSQQVPSSNKKQKLTFLQESIYKDDQRDILNTLMENKKRLDKEKMKRQIDKSNVNVKQKFTLHNGQKYNPWKDETQIKQRTISGVVGSNGKKKHDIVDFRTFKDRDKLKIQLRQANLAYTKYMKKDTF